MSYLIKQTKIEIDKNTIGSDDAEIIYETSAKLLV